MKANQHPVKTSKRIQSLDILRGFAILGILVMNIQSFAMPGAAYLNPMAYGDMTGFNKVVWIVSHIFADQKFMTIFSLLYGAGIVMVTQNAEKKIGKSASLHYRRTFWLLIIGLIHAHIIWYGDILVAYALCALFMYFLRNVRPTRLFVIGIIFISVHSLMYLMFGYSLPQWPEASIMSTKASWLPSAAQLSETIEATTGSLSEQIVYNSEQAFFMETFVFLSLMIWRAGGLMMIGMAFFKWNILNGSKSAGFYKKGFVISWLIGLPIVIYSMIQNFSVDFSMDYSMFIGAQYNYWGSLPIAFGYICLIMLFAKSNVFSGIKSRLAAIGQMALTNYIAQSIIGVLIFYGVGFGLYGTVDRTSQILITIVIWMLQLVWSRPWLDSYRFGPLEWLWRSLTYMKKQPFKK